MEVKTNKNHIFQKGFTLLELLLVITLISILITIGVTSFNTSGRFAEARNDVRKRHIQTIENALTQYKLRTGNYPTGLDRTYREICDPDASSCSGFVDLKQFLVPNYLQAIPQDPNDSDNTGGAGYSLAVDVATNTISVRALQAEGGVIITTNDPLPAETTVTANAPLAATVPVVPPINCPANYIPVTGNILYQTSDFCVMKYEAKAGSSTVAATTQASGTPKVSISQTNAIIACSLNGASYGLINNAEWMTIARNIEGQLSNWTTGTAASTAIGTGGLYRGHSDITPNTTLEAGADNDGYIGTGNSGFSIERRTHTLSNGETIWDLSGNVWEWTSDTIMGVDKPNSSSGNLWQNWSVFNTEGNYGSLSYDLTRPSNSAWDSTQNMGQYYAGPLTGGPFAFRRGGDWGNTVNAGVFTMRLADTPTHAYTDIGFRCVVR